MKTERNILIAFILNLFFSVFEFVGGIFTGSVAIISDAVHDIGDAMSVGASYLFERKSREEPDENYTYGYTRFSLLGGFITTAILIIGSIFVIYNSVTRIMSPTVINYDGMIVFAVIGVVVNFAAAYITNGGNSANQKAVSLHMLEDVLGWAVILIGALFMRFTGFALLDPIMSIGVATFILTNAFVNLRQIFCVFLEKIPRGIKVSEIKEHLLKIDDVLDVHHIHIWSMDGQSGYATMHIVTDSDGKTVKEKVKQELSEHGIYHSVLELETENEDCKEKVCSVKAHSFSHHHHHH